MSVRLLLTCAIVAAALARGQAQQATFTSRTDVVNVDAVVFDRQGNPVEGLKATDFLVREDGKSQDVVTFDSVSLRTDTAPEAAAQRIATNRQTPDAAARWFFAVWDDANITPTSTARGRQVLSQLITQVLRPGDHLMIAAASGGPTWTGTLPQDREDLLAFVNRLKGEHTVESGAGRIWDSEAIGIALGRDPQAQAQVARRYFENGLLLEGAITPSKGATTSEGTNLSKELDVSPGVAMIQAKARQTYTEARSRMQLSLTRLERMSAALAQARGRKTLFIFSEGFINDTSLPNFKSLIQSARNANVAVNFVDVAGAGGNLSASGIPGGGVEVGQGASEQDVTTALALATREGEGTRYLAKETGGSTITGTNLLAGLRRVVDESRSYYLLGYSPTNARRDGKFRQIQVSIKGRPELTVRARSGYFAPAADAPAAAPSEDKLNPDVRAALDSPFGMPGLPMRMASYVLAPRTDGKVQTLLVAEADITPLKLRQFLGAYSAKLDSYVLVHDRDRDQLQRDEKLVELSLPPALFEEASRNGLPVVREFSLDPGHYQATIVLRDRDTGLLGSVRQDFDVPASESFHLSTPIVTDITQASPGATVARAVPVAHRAFAAGSRVFAAFDILGTSRPAGGEPRVTLSYALRRADGTPVATFQPQALRPNARGQFSVTLGVTLPPAAVGDHQLVLTVRDEVAGKNIEVAEPLTITR